MELTEKLLTELQRRLKIGNRRGVHLNAIPASSRYKFDLYKLSYIDKNLPQNFINALLSENPLKFRISWKENVADINALFEEDQAQLVKITKSLENLINQTETIESEKGINTFGFGFPIVARRDKADNKLTVAPILIWSLRIRRTKEFNTWEILRNEDDPIYLNEVLINHLNNDANIEIDPIPSEMLDDGLIQKDEVVCICANLIRAVNTSTHADLNEVIAEKINAVKAIGDKAHYEKLPLNSTNALIDFSGLFSIFEVQKQNIIDDYTNLLELEGTSISLGEMEKHSFQSISSVETDPSQQSILHALESTRNVLIQGPPGTGKSQTLTAVLVNALENNKRTIVVCEKRTALEVLHNALIEKGLNYQCVLIRDIVKDRKTVVDSVRDRVDYSEYKRYSYSYSKDSLENIISKAKELIRTINKRHLKVDEKLIRSDSWTDVVGRLLKALRASKTDANLDINMNIFKFKAQELEALLSLVQKGQGLYEDFRPITNTSFINHARLVGDNPYFIEQRITDDFNEYAKKLEDVKALLEVTRKEFFTNRKDKFKSESFEIITAINNILEKGKAFDGLIESSKSDYKSYRDAELEQQKKVVIDICDDLIVSLSLFESVIEQSKTSYSNHRMAEFSQQANDLQGLIDKIETIFTACNQNKDLTDTEKINSFGYRFSSIFSKAKKETIADNKKLHVFFSQLNETLQQCSDYEKRLFDSDLEKGKRTLALLQSEIELLAATSKQIIEKEFDALRLRSSFKVGDEKKFLSSIDNQIGDNQINSKRRTLLAAIKEQVHSHLKTISNQVTSITQEINGSKDISLHPKLDINVFEIQRGIQEFKQDLKTISIDKKAEEEFDTLKLSYLVSAKDIDVFFKSAANHLNTLDSPKSLQAFLPLIRERFEKFFEEITSGMQHVRFLISVCKDIQSVYSFSGSFNDNKIVLSQIKAELETTAKTIDSKIKAEFERIDLLRDIPNEVKLQSLPLLQSEVHALADKIKTDDWAAQKIQLSSFYTFLWDVEGSIQQKARYFDAHEDLFTIEFKWFQFYNGLTDTEKAVINDLKPKSDWEKSFFVFYLNAMLTNAANLDLPTNDAEHLALDTTLENIEAEQLKFIKQFWFSKQIDATREFEQKNVNLTVENLYNKRSGKRFKRLSLRQIVQYDATLFTTFFPIILTSPDVASNLFKGMNNYFDIVMFDEASQLRLEDNLPALLKGKQMVIAGDEHQMPPSNYFSKVFDGSVEDEEDIEEENKVNLDKDEILLSCESLLDFGTELNFEKKHLDFHYRSRHPFLIDFSNYAFYNQRLKPLPNNFDYIPIKYVPVNGIFTEHVNEAEAEMVLSIIEHNINRLPNGEYPTIGIATFNIAQRNLIKSKILERQKFSKYEKFNVKIQELEENGMFVKNLENIQGDERDVIILSTTYGIGRDRKFSQRFGPINHSKGYKLLNVIITRAKYKVYVCSSIPEQVFLNYKEYLTLEGSNNKRAVFYAYLAYCKAVSEGNQEQRLSVLTTLAENTSKSASFDSFMGYGLESPFEEEVYQSLVDHFGTDKLIPQLQFAGFRIDIVYDTKLPGVPKIAVECDGAKYHSSREAYLYDRHRQRILEEHGFVFHRIWSTNWWRNADRETSKLIAFIKKVESTKLSNWKDYSSTAFAFTNEVKTVQHQTAPVSFVDEEKEVEVIQSMETTVIETIKADVNKVKLNSKVKVKYANTGKGINVHLVPTENNKNEPGNGYQKIHYKSPLAVSLIGYAVGDIVKIGNLDNFVEILEITN